MEDWYLPVFIKNFRYLNYYEGRKFPFSYERDIYKQSKETIVDQSELTVLGCKETAKEQLENYKMSAKIVLESNDSWAL